MNRRGHFGDRRGMAMGMAILLLGVLTLSAGAFFTLLHMTLSQEAVLQRRAEAMGLAEAGLERAMARLRAGNGAYEGESDRAMGEGVFNVRVARGDEPGMYTIASTAESHRDSAASERVSLEAEVRVAPGGAVEVRHWREVRP